MPHAKAFVNDRVSTLRPRRSRIAVTAEPSWEDTLTQLKKDLEKKCGNFDSYTSELPWQQQKLEQKLLRQAIIRGNTDSPFLPQPPSQCLRCARMGETACLQQSTDLTNTASSTAGKGKASVACIARLSSTKFVLALTTGLQSAALSPDFEHTNRQGQS
ncbi:hypothetical protein Sste5344_000505 [Sporothrix stenoceras]